MKAINRKTSKIVFFTVVLIIVALLLVIFLFKDRLFLSRDYRDELYIDIPNTEYQLLVKEWSFLTGSGQEVYFVEGSWWKRPKLLGQFVGEGNGYYPFESGDYTIDYENGVLYLSWKRNSNEEGYSQTKSFKLPI